MYVCMYVCMFVCYFLGHFMLYYGNRSSDNRQEMLGKRVDMQEVVELEVKLGTCILH